MVAVSFPHSLVFVLQVPLPRAEDKAREQNETPIIQGEMLRDLLWPLRYTQVYGAGQEPPKDTEGAGASAHRATLSCTTRPG